MMAGFHSQPTKQAIQAAPPPATHQVVRQEDYAAFEEAAYTLARPTSLTSTISRTSSTSSTYTSRCPFPSRPFAACYYADERYFYAFQNPYFTGDIRILQASYTEWETLTHRLNVSKKCPQRARLVSRVPMAAPALKTVRARVVEGEQSAQVLWSGGYLRVDAGEEDAREEQTGERQAKEEQTEKVSEADEEKTVRHVQRAFDLRRLAKAAIKPFQRCGLN